MARKVFFSFHFEEDNWRTGQVRNIGAIEGNKPLHDNDWEEVKKKGERAIQQWIDNQLFGTSCVIVLIGNKTYSRKWVQYEIRKGWELGKGVLGIYIHGLLDRFQKSSSVGLNPFNSIITFTTQGVKSLGTIIPTHYPPHTDSKLVYQYINDNIESWVEEAIKIRNRY